MSDTTAATPAPAAVRRGPPTTLARRAGFWGDIATVARRAVRSLPREPEFLAPALFIPAFFYAINIGSLQDVAERTPGFDFKAFQLPVAIIFAVTGLSRANVLVLDIQGGYFNKLMASPVRRAPLLLGLMVADVVLVFCLSLLVVAMGFAVGVRFETGVGGLLVFLLLSSSWGLAFTGFPYAVALRTGNPAAVNSTFLIFFPFAFLTSAFLPLDSLTSWLRAIAMWNPVTYLLDGMRSLVTEGWDAVALLKAFGAVAGVGAVSFFLAFSSLRGRMDRG